MSHLVNLSAADQLIARPKTAMQFHPAAIKPAVATPAPIKMFPSAVFQPGLVRGPARPLTAAPSAPFVTMPVAQRMTSSTPMTNPMPMDLSRFFQTPIGNGSDQTTYTTTTTRPVRSVPFEREVTPTEPAVSATADAKADVKADLKQEQKTEVPVPQAVTSSTQTADESTAEPSAPQIQSQAQGEFPSAPPATSPRAEPRKPGLPPQTQSPTQPAATPAQPRTQTPPEAQAPPPARTAQTVPPKKANEFPQCDADKPTSDPDLVRKMFASILKITDTNSQSLRQQEMVWMAYPTLALVPQGKFMYTIIGHPMHNTSAPSSFCQEGGGVRVTMDVSHDPMVRAKVGNSIVAHLKRTGNGNYISKARDGSVTHYVLEGGAAPYATAGTAMATR